MGVTWVDLTREQQRIIAKLYGAGSIRRSNPEAVLGLRTMLLLDGERLSALGISVCEERLTELAGIIKMISALDRAEVSKPEPESHPSSIPATDNFDMAPVVVCVEEVALERDDLAEPLRHDRAVGILEAE